MAPGKFDPTLNRLVPKHEVLSDKKAEEVLANFGIDKNKLPRIKKDDPQVKVLKAKVGDVIKITRQDPDIKKPYEHYRVVVK